MKSFLFHSHTSTSHSLLPLTLSLLRPFWSSSSTDKLITWSSPTNVIITNPTLLILESCSSMLELKQIQAHMTRTALITHNFLMSRLLAFCALSNGGNIGYAHVLFTQIKKPNTYMWNTMIRGYSRADSPSIGFSFFHKMVREQVELDSRSFVFALKVCGTFAREIEGRSVHCLIWKMGFYLDLLVRNGLVHFYSHRGCLKYARQVFDENYVRDVFTWTTMIDGYSTHTFLDDALNLFDSMLLSEIEPNEVTMIAVISVCSQKGELSIGKRVHEYIARKRHTIRYSLNLLNAIMDMYVKCGCLIDCRDIFESMEIKDVYSWTIMLNGYAKCGDLESARKVFNEMPDRNVVSWNAMIAGYSQNNKPKEALKLFNEMVEDANLVPIENTLVCVLSSCGQLGCLETGRGIHHYYIKERKIQMSVILANAIIDMYAKCGSIDDAIELFDGMAKRDLVSWNSMISGFALHGHAKQAQILFERMNLTGLKPNDITFIGLLSACSHSGLVSQGKGYFKSMERTYGLEPKVEHYACMIDLLGRNGELEEAYGLIKTMPIKPSIAVWGALLNACRIHGNVDLAKIASDKLVGLDPDDSGIYVLLANTCAKGKRWNDVRMARSMMRQKGVKKTPGYSLVEVKGLFHEFFVADDSHPQSVEIYKVLKDIFLLFDFDVDCNDFFLKVEY